jgi:hypothetical protein
VRVGSFVLAHYVLVTEEGLITKPPTLTIVTPELKFNAPVQFDIDMRKLDNAMLKINYDDGASELFALRTDPTDQLGDSFTLRVNHTFTAASGKSSFNVRVSLANHLAKQASSAVVLFENSMPAFRIRAVQDVQDTTQTAVFTLAPVLDGSKPVSSVEVPLIVIQFEQGNPNSVLTLNSIIFNAANGFKLNVTYTYAQFGVFTVSMNCSNTVSSAFAQTSIKVGTELSDSFGYLVNPYANVNENVGVFVRLQEGNSGYSLIFDFGDESSTPLIVPWPFIMSRGSVSSVANTKTPELLRERVKFVSYGLVAYNAYAKPGVYSVKVNLTNPLSSVAVGICANANIQAAPVESEFDPAVVTPGCVITADDLKLSVNNAVVNKNLPIMFGRGK